MAGSGLLFEGGQVNNASIAAAIAALQAQVDSLESAPAAGLPLTNAAGDDVAALDANDNIFLQGYDGSDTAQGTIGFDVDGVATVGGPLYLGVGNSGDLQPSTWAANLKVQTSYTDNPAGYLFGVESYVEWNPDTDYPDNSAEAVTGYVALKSDSTKTIGYLTAADFYAEMSAAGGEVAGINGVYAYSQSYAGVSGDVIGVSAYGWIGDTANATNLYGVYASSNASGSSSATSAFGVYSSAVCQGATLTNAYGVFSLATGATNNFSFYEDGGNWFVKNAGSMYCGSAPIIGATSAPADGDLVAGQMAIWFDDTDGAAKFMVKAKQADGAVKTGSFNVQT